MSFALSIIFVKVVWMIPLTISNCVIIKSIAYSSLLNGSKESVVYAKWSTFPSAWNGICFENANRLCAEQNALCLFENWRRRQPALMECDYVSWLSIFMFDLERIIYHCEWVCVSVHDDKLLRRHMTSQGNNEIMYDHIALNGVVLARIKLDTYLPMTTWSLV